MASPTQKPWTLVIGDVLAVGAAQLETLAERIGSASSRPLSPELMVALQDFDRLVQCQKALSQLLHGLAPTAGEDEFAAAVAALPLAELRGALGETVASEEQSSGAVELF